MKKNPRKDRPPYLVWYDRVSSDELFPGIGDTSRPAAFADPATGDVGFKVELHIASDQPQRQADEVAIAFETGMPPGWRVSGVLVMSARRTRFVTVAVHEPLTYIPERVHDNGEWMGGFDMPLLPAKAQVTSALLSAVRLSRIRTAIHWAATNTARERLHELVRPIEDEPFPGYDQLSTDWKPSLRVATTDELRRIVEIGEADPATKMSSLPDSFFRAVAQAVLAAVAHGESPYRALERDGVDGRPGSGSTVERWIREARRRNYLRENSAGQRDFLPGPRLDDDDRADALDGGDT